MEPLDQEMTLRDYWRVIVRRRWFVIVAVVLATGAALGLSLAQTPIYSASTELLVQPRTAGGLFQNQMGSQASNDRTIQTEIQVLTGETVRERVGEKLALDVRPPAATASSVSQTDVVRVTVRHTDPASAARLADAYAQAYIEIRREQSVDELLAASVEIQQRIEAIDDQLDALAADDPRRPSLLTQQATFRQTIDQLQVDAALRTGGASVIRPAEIPEAPVEPTPSRSAALAAVVGLLIGLGAAFLVDYTDRTVRNEDDLARLTPVPVLSVVPVDVPPDHRPISISRPDDYAVETYRGLCVNLQFLALDQPLRIVQVVSSIPGEGKTTTASNLAVVLAQAGQRVVIVDGDLRRPRIHEVFAKDPAPGLTDLLLADAPDSVVQDEAVGDDDTLGIVTAGLAPPNPSELRSGPRIKAVLADLADRYDYVIVDAAPLLPVSDSIALTGAVDGVLVVVQAGRTTSTDLVESMERLGRVNAPVVGIVLNQASASESGGYGYGRGYGYGKGYGYGTGYGRRSDDGTSGDASSATAARRDRSARRGNDDAATNGTGDETHESASPDTSPASTSTERT